MQAVKGSIFSRVEFFGTGPLPFNAQPKGRPNPKSRESLICQKNNAKLINGTRTRIIVNLVRSCRVGRMAEADEDRLSSLENEARTNKARMDAFSQELKILLVEINIVSEWISQKFGKDS
jgi:alpha-D-ribose 1-methylphosphonate 5-triphosphate synthase subunit PhnI